MSEPNIPNPPKNVAVDLSKFLGAVKSSIELLMGLGRTVEGDRAARYSELTALQTDVLAVVDANSTPSGDIPDPPTDLVVTKGMWSHHLAWNNPLDTIVSHIEIWVAVGTQSRSSAELRGVVTVTEALRGEPCIYIYQLEDMTADHTYWIRSISYGGNASTWEPPDAQGGYVVPGDETIQEIIDNILELLTGNITEDQLYQDLSSRIDLIDNPATGLIDLVDGLGAAVATETNTRISEDEAIASTVTGVLAIANANTSSIVTEASTRASADSANASLISQVSTTVDDHTTTIEINATSIDGIEGKYTVKIDNNGYISGFGLISTNNNATPTSEFIVLADEFKVVTPGLIPRVPFIVGSVGGVSTVGINGNLVVDSTILARHIQAGSITADRLKSTDIFALRITVGSGSSGLGNFSEYSTLTGIIEDAQDDADTANTTLGYWASDSKLSPQEKITMAADWRTRCAEYIQVKAQATTLGKSTSTLATKFAAWGTYLNNGSTWSIPTSMPVSDAQMPLWLTESYRSSFTTISRSTFLSRAEEYFDALLDIKGALVWPFDNQTYITGEEIYTGKISGNSNYSYYDLDNNRMHFSDNGELTFYDSSQYIYGGSGHLSMVANTSQQINLYSNSIRVSSQVASNSSITLDARGTVYVYSDESDTLITGDDVVLNGRDGVYIKKNGSNVAIIGSNGIYPGSNNTYALGGATSYLWSNVYATAYYDNGGGYNDTMDDLVILSEFKPRKIKKIDKESGKEIEVSEIDPKNESEFLDINSLPEWMTDKSDIRKKLKSDNCDLISDQDIEELLADYEEAGCMVNRNISAFNDLTNGAVRQLDSEMIGMFELMSSRITNLEQQVSELTAQAEGAKDNV